MTTALNGYSAKLTGAALDTVLADPNVAYVAEDATTSFHDEPSYSPTAGPATRDLPAVDAFGRRATTPINGTSYLGQGVDIYMLGDTHPYAGCLC